MKIVMLSDLHGNLPATLAMERMLDTIAPDAVFFLGDAVGKGPSNAETCDWVRQHCSLCVGGNWDYGIGGKEFAEDSYFWNQLGEERLNWLRSLPPEAEITIGGTRFRLCHGRPVTELMFVQDKREVLAKPFRNGDEVYGGVIFADSHRPFVRALEEGYIINTGSVGNSLGINRAHALLVEGDPEATQPTPLMFTILSVPYDNEAAADLARKDPALPHQQAYINEVLTGVYSR